MHKELYDGFKYHYPGIDPEKICKIIIRDGHDPVAVLAKLAKDGHSNECREWLRDQLVGKVKNEAYYELKDTLEKFDVDKDQREGHMFDKLRNDDNDKM